MAIDPRSCAATDESAPLNDPTGVRAALAITMDAAWLMKHSLDLMEMTC
jgi:hypothetical protein